MKNLNSVLFAIFGLGMCLSVQAAPQTILECTVKNSVDRIESIRVEPTDLEGQIAATTTIVNPNQSRQSFMLVSNGSVFDEQIYLFETSIAKVGTTYRYLEKVRGDYTITQYFRCDPASASDNCHPDSDNLRYQGKSGKLDCKPGIQ